MIHNLFPTPIGFYKVEITELDAILSQEQRSNTGNTTSVNNNLLDVLPDLKKQVLVHLDDYFQSVYQPKHDVKLRITQSWANYTNAGQFHHKHAHPNSFVSGVLYPKADKEKDKIFFYKDGYQQIKIPPKDWNHWNSESWWFEVGVGDLVLFPSSLTHMVETVNGESRVSIAFNTFPVGYVGDDLDLTGLHLGE
jgi:uncharacterized protein (TIGR02466 family)